MIRFANRGAYEVIQIDFLTKRRRPVLLVRAEDILVDFGVSVEDEQRRVKATILRLRSEEPSSEDVEIVEE